MLTNEEHGICILKKVLRSRHPHHPATEGTVVAWEHDHAFGDSDLAEPLERCTKGLICAKLSL